VTRQAVTKHLDVLAHAGLVSDRRDGRERLFEIDAAPLARARSDLDAISTGWDRALARLRDHVEE
jgi:DNA-binding transcriptional ArsR family regulator